MKHLGTAVAAILAVLILAYLATRKKLAPGTSAAPAAAAPAKTPNYSDPTAQQIAAAGGAVSTLVNRYGDQIAGWFSSSSSGADAWSSAFDDPNAYG